MAEDDVTSPGVVVDVGRLEGGGGGVEVAPSQLSRFVVLEDG